MNYPYSLNIRTFRLTNGRPRLGETQFITGTRATSSSGKKRSARAGDKAAAASNPVDDAPLRPASGRRFAPGRNHHLTPLPVAAAYRSDADALTTVDYVLAQEEADRVALQYREGHAFYSVAERFFRLSQAVEEEARQRLLAEQQRREEEQAELVAHERDQRRVINAEELHSRQEIRAEAAKEQAQFRAAAEAAAAAEAEAAAAEAARAAAEKEEAARAAAKAKAERKAAAEAEKKAAAEAEKEAAAEAERKAAAEAEKEAAAEAERKAAAQAEKKAAAEAEKKAAAEAEEEAAAEAERKAAAEALEQREPSDAAAEVVEDVDGNASPVACAESDEAHIERRDSEKVSPMVAEAKADCPHEVASHRERIAWDVVNDVFQDVGSMHAAAGGCGTSNGHVCDASSGAGHAAHDEERPETASGAHPVTAEQLVDEIMHGVTTNRCPSAESRQVMAQQLVDDVFAIATPSH